MAMPCARFLPHAGSLSVMPAEAGILRADDIRASRGSGAYGVRGMAARQDRHWLA